MHFTKVVYEHARVGLRQAHNPIELASDGAASGFRLLRNEEQVRLGYGKSLCMCAFVKFVKCILRMFVLFR